MELFVLIACLQGVACSEVSNTYFYYNPQALRYVQNSEKEFNKELEKRNLNHVTTMLLIMSGHEFNVKLNRNWALKGNQGWSNLALSYSRQF